jgi:hypothetical protein
MGFRLVAIQASLRHFEEQYSLFDLGLSMGRPQLGQIGCCTICRLLGLDFGSVGGAVVFSLRMAI